MTDDLTLYDLANQVLDWGNDCTKHEWGEELLRLAQLHPDAISVQQELNDKIVAGLGKYVSDIKASRERKAHAARLMNRAVSYSGRVMTPTISIRDETGATQGVLWIHATPAQFIDAVLREQAVVDGRNRSNRLRLHLVKRMQADESLRELAMLKDVCDAEGIDPDTLGLDELEAS